MKEQHQFPVTNKHNPFCKKWTKSKVLTPERVAALPAEWLATLQHTTKGGDAAEEQA